ncbi:nucleotide modification associated domain-containing protein [uncultured Veillonella sp.]|uniref:nucleotide modification associated domain-containing protein n=1 Tax=uncultured Veillonella sp. TaxID=159268 RepID=UPI00259A14EB|nr:nucleotide modification associated domain-containing protein [uncultured Veillonella sp.]
MKQVKLKLTPQNMHDAHKELQDIFVKKNTDYGNSFEESLEKHGLIAAIVRMEDKMSRLNTLSKNKALVKDESIIDTLKDLSNYALMTAVWLEQDEDVKIPVNELRENSSPEFIELVNNLERIIRIGDATWLVAVNVSAFQDDTMDIIVTDKEAAYDYIKDFFKDKEKTFIFERIDRSSGRIAKAVSVTVIDKAERMSYKPQFDLLGHKKGHHTATFGVDDTGRPIVVKNHGHDEPQPE